jgi:hypothetical protein
MPARVFLALACALLILRLPSLVQPMGADQGLYAYVGERILDGELPYRDAWDQKPPAIHYTYALLSAVLPATGLASAADLAATLGVTALLLGLGTALVGRGTGQAAALAYLFLSDPSFHRLAGVAVRAQCETFIGMAVTGAFFLLARHRTKLTPGILLSAGVLLGAAFAFKYNAAVYGVAALLALWAWRRLTWRAAALVVAGSVVVPLALFLVFAVTGTVQDLYDATILYNLRYSEETYEGLGHFLRYLLTFPVQHARVNGLWVLGGTGCAVLLAASWTDRERLVVPVWVAAACLVIAFNGSRGLPQYFIQALPPLALAATWGGRLLWRKSEWTLSAWLALAVAAFAIWRVNEFSNLVRNVEHDASYVFGRISREAHLARYGDPGRRKYSALAMDQLGTFVRERTSPNDPIYVFGFSGGAYVSAGRPSASRFCWSRPVIVGFNAHKPGYGVAGLRTDLERERPAIVALQVRDWMPDVQDSAEFFMSTPQLAEWLRANYDPVAGPAGYETWQRR